MILAEIAHSPHGLPVTCDVLRGLADRLQVLLHRPGGLVVVPDAVSFRLQAVSADPPGLAQSIRAREQENNLRSALDIAARAVAAGERITVSIDGASHLGKEAPAGVLIASPFRTSRSNGVILVYPRPASQ